MIAKKKKNGNYQEIIFSILIGGLFFCLIFFLVISNLKINKKRTELFSQIESLKKEIQLLEERNEKLKAGISQSQTEDYWEEKIREQGYKKPGEEQVVVLPPEKTESQKIEEGKNFWQKFLEFLKIK
jgi:cell division protein FtsB